MVGELEKNKKGNMVVGFILMLILGVLIGVLGFFTYDKYFKVTSEIDKVEKNENTSIEKVKSSAEILNIDEDIVLNNYERLKKGFGYYCGVYDYFSGGTVKNTDLSEKVVINVAIMDILKDIQVSRPNYFFNEVGDAFTKKELRDKVTNIFGADYKYEDKDIEGCPTFVYKADLEKYVIETPPACGGTCGPTNLDRVVSAKKIDDLMEINVRIIFRGDSTTLDSNKVQRMLYYKDHNKRNVVEGIEYDYTQPEFAVDNIQNIRKGSLYKFTLKKVNDRDYTFLKAELVK